MATIDSDASALTDDGEFIIRSGCDAQALQLRLDQYRKRRCGGGDPLPPGYLLDLFSYAQSEGANRLFVAVYDLEIAFLFMEIDICSVAGTHNLQFAPGRPSADDVPLLDAAAFAGKMDILEHLTAFTLRCRAFWDKTMGVVFLLCDPSQYDRFARASSRKRFFARHAAEWPDPPSHLLRLLEDSDFRAFDPIPRFPRTLDRVVEHLDGIRTAEAHGTGTLRKSALGTGPIGESKSALLIAHRAYPFEPGLTRC